MTAELRDLRRSLMGAHRKGPFFWEAGGWGAEGGTGHLESLVCRSELQHIVLYIYCLTARLKLLHNLSTLGPTPPSWRHTMGSTLGSVWLRQGNATCTAL